ncbi:MAG TPA: hypothetical protein O0X47_06475 [Methanocorpusculum sp.]|nr:hypothetical protein [Methanocorpusculum sp.]HJJ38171.1 hypothetical protein [Methanocorpusculum sp.]
MSGNTLQRPGMIILPHESLSGSRYLAAKNMPGLAHAKIGSAQSQTFCLLR